MKDKHVFIYGAVIGLLLAMLPWWIGVLAAIALITYMAMKNDDHPKAS